ncbi:MAG: hypothetical protein DWQ18_07770 [Crenarchaeota archaeon]|nr:MAG: hypothetical protein DWQ17_02015 [Thermoproteota archaeon]RDJ33061.1 MAG: hypothetical protein DWQ18_07770 [Thermoproteota archaeon]RDJ36573.1 MAG: hypothetical protein DWQ19_07550 [Thermoproteota archaeon]RDJ39303.1 MAG: hypothetical protein DWQ13_02015 [Thermoproteota archaeon]
MQKKIWLGLIGISIVAIFAVTLQVNIADSNNSQSSSELDFTSKEKTTGAQDTESDYDIVMTNKSSRPGCEKTNSCYVPHEFTISAGESVTWKNDDVAFHSVTSGFYDSPTELFDSGHLDPSETFSVNFDKIGEFDYFCTLHPWMMGKIYVK